jgi:hypothetical protein
VSVEPLCGSQHAIVQDYFHENQDKTLINQSNTPRQSMNTAVSRPSPSTASSDLMAGLLMLCVAATIATGAIWPAVAACVVLAALHVVARARGAASPLGGVSVAMQLQTPSPHGHAMAEAEAGAGAGDGDGGSSLDSAHAHASALSMSLARDSNTTSHTTAAALAAEDGNAAALEPLVAVPEELSAFAAGIPSNLSLNPRQALQLLSSSLYHGRNSSYGLFPVAYHEDGTPHPDLLPNGRADPKYRIPDEGTLTTLRLALQSTETTDKPLPPLAEAQKRPDFAQLLSQVCLDMPARLIEAEEGDEDAARLRWYESVRWRRENRVDTLLTRPYPLFEKVRDICSHYFHKHDRLGHIIYIDRPGLMKFKELKALGVDDAGMQHHFLHNCEYQWNVLDARPDAKVLSILDMDKIGFMDMMGGSTMGLIKKMSKLLQLQYPVRSYKIVIVNAPSWFNSLWKMVSPMLHARTRAKTVVCGSDIKEMRNTLLPLVAPESLPRAYGGTCLCSGEGGCARSRLERDYREFVAMVNNSKGGNFQKLVGE